ncbi:MAG: iron-siderophore ABC transporter substrate-binding protein [Leptolyngbya sp. UWPOB_LEPTO1]|uniref:iron-siderophore ABC transporter substrate-binding protein n=1 Tax=Leptolyngbya sp. UWPOB_LEPTO1 TaxID=2815653 RepID=UPI001AD47BD2|nr:iron-siderophore ABC transporter substrate-binding protein [Leptolyngbya sp. UWPOB_LEPTO1]MBN8560715.1 iron-siderophore ABC transporter substrate-binding protein [Leptolyngbya sp. UWPOB_LEPTO1]
MNRVAKHFPQGHCIFYLCLGLVISVLAVACNSDRFAIQSQARGSLAAFQPASECRLIQHSAGETCVPLHPQRVITLGSLSLESAIALGIQPIATVDVDLTSPQLKRQAGSILSVGSNGEPNLEKILALKPDLILGYDYQSSIYRQASQIAPTVLTKFNHSGEWKDMFTFVARTLGRSQQAEQVMANYYQRLAEFKAKMGDHAQPPKVSIVYLYPEMITVYTTSGFNGSILKDAALARPASQDIDTEATQRKGGISPIQYGISNEQFDAADGDAIFVIVDPTDSKIGKTRQRLLSDPLWSKLHAVQQGKVYEVLDYWIGSGPLAANAVIDDLFKYLLP